MLTYVGAPQLPSDDKRWKIVEATARRHGREPHALIETLHTVQECFGYLDEHALRFVASVLRVPLSRVYGAATFYHFFTLKPKGRHVRRLHRDRLLHQGRAAIAEGHRAPPRHQAGRDHARWRVERAHGALPGVVRPGAGGGFG